MSSQKSSIESFRETVKAIASGIYDIWNLPNLNEAAVRQVIVLRILQASGFDIWNPLEIIPEEFSSGGGRIDLVIKIDGEARFVIELKKLSAVLADKETVQTINYASEKAIRWAIATNGRAWKFFDTHLVQKEAIDRGVLEIELLADKVDLFADDLFGLLLRQVWVDQAFEKSLKKVQLELEKRNEHEKIIREKTPLLESFMSEYTVKDRSKAANLMVELGKLSKLESEILLGNLNISPKTEIQLKQEIVQPNFIETPVLKIKSNVHSQEIRAEEIEEYVTHFANKSSDTKVFWLGQKLSSSSSANIYSCLAEVALKCNIQLRLVTEGERRRGKDGKMLRYILLSNGLYLFMNLSADGIRSHLQTLLKDLKVKNDSLKIIYEGQEYLLP